MRIFLEELTALQRLRGRVGEQKVTVEHVHIHEGGQAVVGTVNTGKPRRDEGGDRKSN